MAMSISAAPSCSSAMRHGRERKRCSRRKNKRKNRSNNSAAYVRAVTQANVSLYKAGEMSAASVSPSSASDTASRLFLQA